MEINQVYHGFRLVAEQPIKEVNSTGRLFVHEKTGAQLLQLANEDNNKVFGIGFRTPSANSTGVAHILEHSVLNGSRKYRTKEPFMDLARTSLNTFLNAMTFSDKTIYPVASRNEKDFEHLMDVYLDAVFFPAVYERKEIFLQEGWHYHIEDVKDPITYRGVVYNEMRGALSSGDSQVIDEIMAALFPDTIYGCESGGNPYDIPSLTYEDFLDFHRKLYHPSNSYSFIYGDGDIDKYLAHINDEYLAGYERLDVDSHVEAQKAFEAPKHLKASYSVSSDTDTEKKDYLTYSVMMGSRQSLKDLFVSEMLTDVLVDAQSAPIKNALLAAGIGEDISSVSSDGIQIPFSIMAKDASFEQEAAFEEIIEKTLRDIVAQGLNQNQLLAALNKIEYSYREASGYATRGIVYYINAFETWLYDGNPFDALAYDAPLNELRGLIGTRYFEEYIKERILDNPHKVILTVRPEAGLNNRKDDVVNEKLAAFKESLTPEALQALVDETQGLLARQNAEDTPEARATIPHLRLEDVDSRFPIIPCEEEKVKEATVLYHPLFTSGINYIDIVGDLGHFTIEELPYIGLMTSLIGSMSTKNYDYSALNIAEYLCSGGIRVTSRVIQNYNDPETFYHKLLISTKTISVAQAADFLHLLDEQLRHTDFTDKKRFREVLQMMKSQIEMGMPQQGHLVTVGRVSAYYSAFSRFNEYLNGLDFLFFLQDLDNHFDERFEETVARIQDIYARLLTREGLLISITTDSEENHAGIRALLSDWIDTLPTETYPHADWHLEVAPLNEGIQSSTNVQYVAKGADLRPYGFVYNGEVEVLSNVLANEYLYNNIRAKGGAYGQGVRFGRNGTMSCYSYRDPNLENTIAVYDGMADYLEQLEMDEDTLTTYIIGVMNRFNPAMTEYAKANYSLTSYINGQSPAAVQKAQEEALSTTVEKIRGYAPILRQAMAENNLCVIGNNERIKASAALFKNVIQLEN